jgi:GINS complex subunit 2
MLRTIAGGGTGADGSGKLIILRAPDDLHQPAQLRSLLKDLREVRQAKIRLGLQSEGVMQGSYLQVC